MTAQLEIGAVASAAPSPVVRIYKLNRAVEIWIWLCPLALSTRESEGWTVQQSKPAPAENPNLACQDRASGCCQTVTQPQREEPST